MSEQCNSEQQQQQEQFFTGNIFIWPTVTACPTPPTGCTSSELGPHRCGSFLFPNSVPTVSRAVSTATPADSTFPRRRWLRFSAHSFPPRHPRCHHIVAEQKRGRISRSWTYSALSFVLVFAQICAEQIGWSIAGIFWRCCRSFRK